MAKSKAYYARKIKKAIHLLLFRRHTKPGARDWELKKALGSDYDKVLKVLDKHLEKLDLKVSEVSDGENKRYFITLRGALTPSELKYCGWRIDDIAGLAITVAFITSKGGKAPKKEIESLLREKMPNWKVKMNIERFIKAGYVGEDESGNLYLDWRTMAEVDQKTLIELLMALE